MTDRSKIVDQALVTANISSQTARAMWLSFLGLVAYLIVTLAGVTHKDLLLNSAVKLPIVNVEMPLISFFIFAPCLLVLIHFGLLMQHVTLAQKLKFFDEELKQLAQPKSWDEKIRLQLHGYSITQYIAGPRTSRIILSGQWFMGWLTLNLLPLAVLLYVQTQFLPYHSEPVTMLHRVAILVDLIVLFPLGMLVEHPTSTFKEVLLHNIRQRKGFLTLSGIATTFVLIISFATVTFPGERIDRFMVDNKIGTTGTSGSEMFALTAIFHYHKLGSWFARNLIVIDEDLVNDSKLDKDSPSLRLRDRDLLNARFQYTDLHRADLRNADLRYAQLTFANLKNAVLAEANLQDASLEGANLSGANLSGANLSGAVLSGTKLNGAMLGQNEEEGRSRATFTGAYLSRADLSGADAHRVRLANIDLSGAIFRGANLTRASFFRSNLTGANFTRANLTGAKLTGANLTGANLTGANLSGADLIGAKLGANFTGANFTGAKFGTRLTGANLSGANLSGAIFIFGIGHLHKACGDSKTVLPKKLRYNKLKVCPPIIPK